MISPIDRQQDRTVRVAECRRALLFNTPPLPSRWCSPLAEFPKADGHEPPYIFHRMAMFRSKLQCVAVRLPSGNLTASFVTLEKQRQWIPRRTRKQLNPTTT